MENSLPKALSDLLSKMSEETRARDDEIAALRAQLAALEAEKAEVVRELVESGIKQCDYDLDTFPDARSWIWIPDHNEGTATTAAAPTLARWMSEGR